MKTTPATIGCDIRRRPTAAAVAHSHRQWRGRRGRCARCARSVRGQSLVETLVFAMALLPLLLGLVLVTKYQSIRQSAIAASRTVAFDCTVRPDSCGQGDAATLLDEAWQRHLSDARTPLQSVGAGAGQTWQHNGFWLDRRQAPLIAGTGASRVDLVREQADTSGTINDVTLGLVEHFGLPMADDLVRADVRVRVSEGRGLADWLVRPEGLQLDLAGRTAILVDNWNASEGRGEAERSVEARVARGSVPPIPGFAEAAEIGYLPIRTLITSPLLEPFEPKGKDFAYHEFDVELVPPDRLGETR